VLFTVRWLTLPPGEAIYSKLHPLKLYSNQYGHILSDMKVGCYVNVKELVD